LPENKRTAKRPAHNLDCAVINHLHQMLAENVDTNGNPSPLPPFNSVRGLYQEDDPVFDGSKILSKTHIQITVLTPETSIQGYFRVPEAQYR
jgi:hypothetical protein